MNVLVIGGAGYVGAPLTYRLWSDGHRVTVLDVLLFGGESLVPLLGKERFELVSGDLRSVHFLERSIPGHDAIVLLAAIVGEPACKRDPDAAVATNLEGTRKVLMAARKAGIPRFIFISTCSSYGVSDQDAALSETAASKPMSIYAETKVAAERMVLAEAGNGFSPSVLRLATGFGVSPRMRFDLLISDFTRAAVCEGRITIYGEQSWRPHVHVNDAADAVTRTLQADADTVAGQIYNVGSNMNNVRKVDLGEKVRSIVGNTELEFVEQRGDPRSYRVDFSKIESVLDYRAKWSIDAGIEELVKALRDGVFPDPYDTRYTN